MFTYHNTKYDTITKNNNNNYDYNSTSANDDDDDDDDDDDSNIPEQWLRRVGEDINSVSKNLWSFVEISENKDYHLKLVSA